MASIRRSFFHSIGIGLMIYACMLMNATARPSRSSEASLRTAEKLLTEALKKEIDDALSKPITRSDMADGSDNDIFTEVLEEAAEGVGNKYPKGREGAAKGDKAIGYSKAQMAASAYKGDKVESTAKFGSAAPGQQGMKRKNIKQNSNGFKGVEMLRKVLEMPVRNDFYGNQMQNTKQESLTQPEPGSPFKKPNIKLKEYQNPSQPSKQAIYSAKGSKTKINAHGAALPQTQGKSLKSHDQYHDDIDIASKIGEFYNMLHDYADKNAVKTEPSYEEMSLARRQKVLPLDQPIQLSSNSDAYKDKKTWLQKRTEDEQKLAAEMEKLAAALKQEGNDSPDDEFPSFSKWFQHHRGLSNFRKERLVNAYRSPRFTQNEADDAFSSDKAKDLEANYPWNKYFREMQSAGGTNYVKERKEDIDSNDQKFMNEIEARVAELQQQLYHKRYTKRSPTLRM